mmetsp:Transcript_14948/g.22823  ORF Transcript_14948/g.22823 Transcript_14948/m.22823 type:complete len:125 (+) Transcript_14948:568-942(+)
MISSRPVTPIQSIQTNVLKGTNNKGAFTFELDTPMTPRPSRKILSIDCSNLDILPDLPSAPRKGSRTIPTITKIATTNGDYLGWVSKTTSQGMAMTPDSQCNIRRSSRPKNQRIKRNSFSALCA